MCAAGSTITHCYRYLKVCLPANPSGFASVAPAGRRPSPARTGHLAPRPAVVVAVPASARTWHSAPAAGSPHRRCCSPPRPPDSTPRSGAQFPARAAPDQSLIGAGRREPACRCRGPTPAAQPARTGAVRRSAVAAARPGQRPAADIAPPIRRYLLIGPSSRLVGYAGQASGRGEGATSTEVIIAGESRHAVAGDL